MNKRFSLQLAMLLIVAVVSSGVGAFAAVKKKVPVRRGTGAVHAVTSSSKKRPGATTRVSSSKRGKSKGSTTAQTTWRNRQAAPSSDRYKEIQQALVAKGYLKSTPNGVWDSQSSDALKQFQSERKLSPTGKINAASLIGLGLGPKRNPGTPTAHFGGGPGGTPETPVTR